MKTDETLSSPGSRQLTKAEGDGNREVLIQYYSGGGEESGILLTEKQKELRLRWEFADDTIRVNMGKLSRGEMANVIATRFKLALSTAKADMTNAEIVFSSSNPINRKARMGLRIEWLEKQSRLAAADNDFIAVAMLEKSICKYLEIYPENVVARPRRIVNQYLQQNFIGDNPPQPTEETEAILVEALKQIEENGDDV